MASDDEIEKTQEERKRMEKQLASLTSVTFDTDLYGGIDKGAYVSSIPVNDNDDNAEAMDNEIAWRMAASYTAPKSVLNKRPRGADADEDLGFKKPQRIIDREDDYRQWRLNRIISPERHDLFTSGEKTPDSLVRTYADVMKEEALKREKDETLKLIAKKMKEKEEAPSEKEDKPAAAEAVPQKRRNQWDHSQDGDGGGKKAKTSDWDLPDTTLGKWDATPTPAGAVTPSAGMVKKMKMGRRERRGGGGGHQKGN